MDAISKRAELEGEEATLLAQVARLEAQLSTSAGALISSTGNRAAAREGAFASAERVEGELERTKRRLSLVRRALDEFPIDRLQREEAEAVERRKHAAEQIDAALAERSQAAGQIDDAVTVIKLALASIEAADAAIQHAAYEYAGSEKVMAGGTSRRAEKLQMIGTALGGRVLHDIVRSALGAAGVEGLRASAVYASALRDVVGTRNQQVAGRLREMIPEITAGDEGDR